MKVVLFLICFASLGACESNMHDKTGSSTIKNIGINYEDQLFLELRNKYGEPGSSTAKLVLTIEKPKNVDNLETNRNKYLLDIYNRKNSFKGAVEKEYSGKYFRLFRTVEKKIWQIMEKTDNGEFWHGGCLEYTSGYK
ncbi:MAG: hypothetical protein V2I33_13090, partial [Kangiellaceae bacterium]|nr:hypothetical protein [Kangiellaceae bacterium]